MKCSEKYENLDISTSEDAHDEKAQGNHSFQCVLRATADIHKSDFHGKNSTLDDTRIQGLDKHFTLHQIQNSELGHRQMISYEICGRRERGLQKRLMFALPVQDFPSWWYSEKCIKAGH